MDAEDRTSVAWETRSAPAIDRLARRTGSVVVVPAGSVEQHGAHLPVATDSILAESVSREAARRVAADLPVLVAPTVSPGFSPHHLSFGGTLSLERDTLANLLTDVARSALDGGFDALVFVNGHRGNDSFVDGAVGAVGRDHPDRAIGGVTYFDLAAPVVDEVRETDAGGMSHAGEFETALMLHCRPDLVDEDRFDATYREESHEHGVHDMFDAGPLSRYREFSEYTDTGVVGDPTAASEAAGARLFDHVAAELAAVLREFHEEAAAAAD